MGGSALLRNAFAVALETTLNKECSCSVEVSEPQITVISHTDEIKVGFVDSFLSLFSSEPPEAEKFEKVTDALLIHMDVQLSSPLQGADPSKGMAPGGQRRHAPGMSGSSDLATFAV